MRATSALLSVLGAVDEFGKAIVREKLGGPAGEIEAFIEVPLKLGDGRTVRPDGLIRATRGRRSWTALVEVKTARNELAVEQVEDYLRAARERGFDAVVTVSNQLSPAPGEHPLKVDGRLTRSVQLHHLSWVAIVTEAVVQHEHREVSDPDQAWILGELIAYLSHEQSGAIEFDNMGPHWTTIRDAARDGTLRSRDEGVDDLLSRWEELARYLSLHLGKELGADVQQVLSRKERNDPVARRTASVRSLVEDGTLACTLRVPDAVADIEITADLRARTVSAQLLVDAPREGRPKTRVNWLARQLHGAPSEVRIDTSFEGTRQTTSEFLDAVAADGAVALLPDQRAVPRRFLVTLTRDMGIKRGSGQGSFIGSVTSLLEAFYREIAQELTAWTPRAPRLPEAEPPVGDETEPDEAHSLSSAESVARVDEPAASDVEQAPPTAPIHHYLAD